MSATSAKEEETEKLDKYTKGLVSSLGHLLGFREGRDGKLHVTACVDEGEDESGCVNIENVNTATAQQWEAGALTNIMEDMNILPPEKIQMIRKRVEEVARSTGGASGTVPKRTGPPPPATSPSSVVTTGGKGYGTTGKVPDQDPFAFSKGPPGFYPPRKVPQSSNVSSTSNGGGVEGDSTTLMQRKQFSFAKPKSPPATLITAQVKSPGGIGGGAPRSSGTSMFSAYEPSNKKPALGPGIRSNAPPVETNAYQNQVTSTFGRGGSGAPSTNRWNSPSAPNLNPGNEDDSQSGGAPGGTGAFKSAYQQLLIDDKRKGIQRAVPSGGGTARAPGLRRPPPKEPEKPVKQSNSASDDESKTLNPEVEELMSHESMKNIDPKMVEAILNEVIQVSTTDWNDIAGLDGVKKIIREIIIWPMERPDIFTGLRAAPRGILFFGPPGTGKTMFGRVIATQSKSTFFNISASSLTSKWIGDGEKMVRALFAVARMKQPSVIFIDEIDSILTQRSDTEHESSRRLKTEFLIQFDGCATITEDRILVIGVTNRPQELDEAARRRLVKRIYIPLPDFVARRQLVKNLIQEYSTDLSEEDYDKISRMTEGYSGADMTSLCREASYGPIREVGHLLQSLELSNVRPMKMKDFAQAQRQVKSSVAASDVELYQEWNTKFGCHLGPSPEDPLTQSGSNS